MLREGTRRDESEREGTREKRGGKGREVVACERGKGRRERERKWRRGRG